MNEPTIVNATLSEQDVADLEYGRLARASLEKIRDENNARYAKVTDTTGDQ
jgi:hypothetical protein